MFLQQHHNTFQFHKGTIRTKDKTNNGDKQLNFNSIKVQLELVPSLLAGGVLVDFNSIKVQLELCLILYFLFIISISIP